MTRRRAAHDAVIDMPPPVSVTHARLKEQEARLYRLFPALEEISCVVSPLAEAPLDDIARLISDAWRQAYGDRIRIAYTPAFLRYCAGPAPAGGLAITAYGGGRPQGVILGLPLDLVYRGLSYPAVLTTGLCVSEAWKGRGLVELLMVKHGQALFDAAIPCGFHWRSAKGATARDAGKRLAQAFTARLWARVLRLKRAGVHGGLSRLEQAGLCAYNLSYALRGGRSGIPAMFQFRPFASDYAEASAALLDRNAAGRALFLRVSPERLVWNCTRREDDIRAAGWALTRAGDVDAIAWGYRNPVSRDDAYFALDRVAFSPTLDLAARRAFMAQVENAARNQLDCFAILMPECVCDTPPERLGYRPVKTYCVGASNMGLRPAPTPAHLAGMTLPLR